MSTENFSGALGTWKSINLSELQKVLDGQGLELVENQKESMMGRKVLADKTKEYKKLPDEEKLSAWKGLLKLYQSEVDNLTKRSKASENAFLGVYKVLAEAPDPYPLLEAAVDQTVKAAEARELELEVQRLKQENADLRRRTEEVSALETAKAKAEEKAEQLERKMEEAIQEKVVQKENELHATYDEKLRNYEEREQDLQRQLTLSNTHLRNLRTSNESTQARLLDASQRQDSETVAKLAEVDMVAADLERANSRVATLERRNELLRAEIEAVRSGSEAADRVSGLESQVSSLESERARLSDLIEAQKRDAAAAEDVANKRLEDALKESQQLLDEVNQFKARLKQYADYDEVKRELDIMKYVEFGGADDDETDENAVRLPDPNADKANAHIGTSLEALLAIKNRRIQEELARFRVLHGELETSLREAEEKVGTADLELEKQRALNERLETDLLSLEDARKQPNGHAPSTAASSEGLNALAGLDIGGKKPNSESATPAVRASPIPFTASADASILPIVTSQRDRFRQRNSELEEELRRQFTIISELRTEIKSLQSDNLKLYEKVRYMQSYREESTSSGRPVSQLDPLPAPSRGGDDMGKYRERYEEAMNPFEAFRGREATRAYSSMNVAERGVLNLTKVILGNRRARTAFIFYAIALHILVAFTTYECTSSSDSQLQRQPKPF